MRILRRVPLFLSLLAPPLSGQQDPCLTSTIGFNTGTLEQILDNPGAVLAEEEAFWEREPAQHYVRMWSEGTGVPIDYAFWRDRLRSLEGLSDDERGAHPLLRTAQRIVDEGDAFLAQAVPHLCAHLPAGAALDVGIHFTAFVPPRSFASGEVVINVAADYWGGSADHILNNLVHELFHVGYSGTRDVRTEAALPDSQLYRILDNLQNEGIATYVAYQARSTFPAPDEQDYHMLDDPATVRRLRGLLNGLLPLVGVVDEERVRQWAWTRGVTQRGFYVVGADMARTIETRLGRAALLTTMRHGPASFVRTYNELVEEAERIRLP